MRSFDEVLGHERAIAGLRESIAAGRISNGYLFCGMPGVGRRTLMGAFAATLLCQAQGTSPCGACESCRLFDGGAHPDILTLDPDGDLIQVGPMREFCQKIAMRASVSPHRVACIPDAGRMNDMAANGFLKTLEEPPGTTVLLLTAQSTDSLLRTIVSRCQVVRLGRLDEDVIRAALMREAKLPEEEACAVASFADGSLGRALALTQSHVAEDWAWVEKTLEGLRPAGAFEFAESLIERSQREGKDTAAARSSAQALLDMLMLYYRLCLRKMDGDATRGMLHRMEAVVCASRQLGAFVKTELVLRALALALAYGGRRQQPEDK